jgi:hypothetical protein
VSELIDSAPEIDDRAILTKADGNAPPQTHKEKYFWGIPALAVPIVSKSEFVCPTNHVDALREFLPKVTRVLIIGWRAAEEPFLQMLKIGLGPDVKGMVVCGGDTSAKETADRLKAYGVGGEYLPKTGGFSDFMQARRIQGLLR